MSQDMPSYFIRRFVIKAKQVDPIDQTPIGYTHEFIGNGAPSPGYVEAEGQTLSRDEFSDLYHVIGMTFTCSARWWQIRNHFRVWGYNRRREFKVPDLRGRILLGFDPAKE